MTWIICGPSTQLAFFHPGFAWAKKKGTPAGRGDEPNRCETNEIDNDDDYDDDDDEAINYEKRAPFPTINLLRVAQVRAMADQVQMPRNALPAP